MTTNAKDKEAVGPTAIQSDEPAELLAGRGWRAARAVLYEAMLRLWDDEALSLAGNIAFRAVLAMFPFLVFVSSLTAFLGDRGISDHLIEFLIAIIPAPLVDTLVAEVRAVATVRRGEVAGVGVLLTIWFALGGVDSVRVGLNRAYDIKDNRSLLAVYGLHILVVICGALVFVVVGYLLIVGTFAHRFLPAFEAHLLTLDAVRYPAAAVILTAALFGAHTFLPARWIRFSNMWPGVLITVVAWIGLAAAFSFYLARFANYASYYAGLAGVIAELFFIYLAALVRIFGGEVNRAPRIRRLGRSLIDNRSVEADGSANTSDEDR
ncbi:YihY/virulence factor BrkB family protein [Rhizobium mongolense]|uniref:Membrane protein n=2 Tax=Rhizobium mongolense TaxID=57676 RepID=A0ABR6IGE1_9HYPH|nr:YihY/virulence factor BrkB family protein [Rhizobium mongolense]MBB4226919.1 membrane protein [Rhizobium mongolense]TVZ74130.1 membrane protein [Rhizobium mongolense USDA 1844]